MSTVRIDTHDLEGDALDWAVSKIQYTKPVQIGDSTVIVYKGVPFDYHPSTDWAQGGQIIEREKIEVFIRDGEWFAYSSLSKPEDFHGETPLIAAMRCYVALSWGLEVDVPEELIK